MDAGAVITLAANRGVKLTADAEHVIAQPGSKLTAELRGSIRAHKSDLLRLLSRDNRPAGIASDTVQNRHPDDDQRRQVSLPCPEGHDDRRCKDNHTEIQTSFDASADSTARLIKTACQDLTITPEQLRRELTEGGDMPDLESGNLSAHALHLTAETLAIMRYPYRR